MNEDMKMTVALKKMTINFRERIQWELTAETKIEDVITKIVLADYATKKLFKSRVDFVGDEYDYDVVYSNVIYYIHRLQTLKSSRKVMLIAINEWCGVTSCN